MWKAKGPTVWRESMTRCIVYVKDRRPLLYRNNKWWDSWVEYWILRQKFRVVQGQQVAETDVAFNFSTVLLLRELQNWNSSIVYGFQLELRFKRLGYRLKQFDSWDLKNIDRTLNNLNIPRCPHQLYPLHQPGHTNQSRYYSFQNLGRTW